ncbi:hypothetical protein [Marinobacter salsuginis]|uniref:hypothetical protein n=1 Tax=Marinobacter salsuginis TaxID=418719 RepID=UPI00129921C5|nr:hypothetical protein [Marinobacter salsuginis]
MEKQIIRLIGGLSELIKRQHPKNQNSCPERQDHPFANGVAMKNSSLICLNSLTLIICLSVFSPTVVSEEQQVRKSGVLSDGTLTKEELAAAMLTAEQDLRALLQTAVDEVKVDVERTGFFAPRAWMQMKDRVIKEVRLSEEAEAAPPKIKLQLFQASLRSVARHNKIDAALVVYPGTIDQGGSERRVVAVEHEHRLGVSGIKLIPLHLENGNAQFGNPLSQKKPFKIFYDE